VDVTDPAQPVFLGSLPTATDASSWRDVKVKNGHALIVSEAVGHGMQVFDLTKLRDASGEGAPQTFEATAVYDGFGRAHNVVTAGEGTARAYGVGLSGEQNAPDGAGCGPGYHGVDLSDPANPQFAGCFNSTVGRGYTHDAQCVTYEGPDAEHQGREICLGADEQGLSVADLTDLESPRQLATATYPQTGYTHQGWFSDDQRYFYLDDETDERDFDLVDQTRTLIWDLEDLDNPVLVTQHAGGTPAIDHNQYLTGGLAYQANYTSGLRILDTSDKAAPVEVGFFDVFPQNNKSRFEGAWSVYPFFEDGPLVVSSIGGGLFVLRATGEAAR
jgi:choice-of-anchor B domain-containing protein